VPEGSEAVEFSPETGAHSTSRNTCRLSPQPPPKAHGHNDLRLNLLIQPDGFSVQNVYRHPGSGVKAAIGKRAKQVNATCRFS